MAVAPQQPPRCTRLTVSAVYDDGSSVVLDIPEPLEATADLHRQPGIPLDPEAVSILPEYSQFTLRVRLGLWPRQQATATRVPVPK